MVKMNSRITIGSLVFENRINSVEIDQRWKQITQSAMIKMPRYTKIIQNNDFKIQVGDAVKIELGYDTDMRTEFEGYISSRSYNTPLEFKCEDEMWKLKQQTVTQSWPSVKLKDVLLYLVPGIDVSMVQDITLAPFRLDRVSIAKALETLKDEFGLVAYFRDKKLFCGLAYTETGLADVFYHFQKNIPQNESKLEFKEESDVRIKVKAVSHLPDNSKIEVEAGDTTHGDATNETTLDFYNIQTKAELQQLADEAIKKRKYTGYRGTLKTFGQPFATHGMIANIQDEKYPERAGRYYIDAVKTIYGESGFRRDVELGIKVAA
jgi:hypothetical protein